MRMRVTGMVGSYKLRYKFLGNYQFVSLHTDTEQVDGTHKQNMKNLFDSVGALLTFVTMTLRSSYSSGHHLQDELRRRTRASFSERR